MNLTFFQQNNKLQRRIKSKLTLNPIKMFKLLLSGIVGNDAEVKEVNNSKLIKFPVAVHTDYKNADGEKVEKTDWVQALWWKNGNQSIKVAEYLKKGKRVILEGEPGIDTYKSKDGEAKASQTITVRNLELVG